MLTGGYINPHGNAWTHGSRLGLRQDAGRPAATTSSGARCSGDDNIVWGTADEYGDNIVWGTCRRRQHRLGHDAGDDNIVWGTIDGDDNIVWGTDCGGSDCDNIVWGTSDDDNIVWGTADRRRQHRLGHVGGDDNIVWGTSRRRQHRLGHVRRRCRTRLPG